MRPGHSQNIQLTMTRVAQSRKKSFIQIVLRGSEGVSRVEEMPG